MSLQALLWQFPGDKAAVSGPAAAWRSPAAMRQSAAESPLQAGLNRRQSPAGGALISAAFGLGKTFMQVEIDRGLRRQLGGRG